MKTQEANLAEQDSEAKKESSMKEFLKRLLKNRLAMFGGIVFLIMCLLAIFANVIAPYGYEVMDIENANQSPSIHHILGTDQYGRDIFSRVIYGGRWSISLGLGASLMSTVLGVIIGSLAGYFGGIVDSVIMRIIDILQCIPGILLTICIAVVLGSGLFNTMFAMAFGGIWGTARMLRGQILTVRNQEYVEAARATNVKGFFIVMRYVLPNSIQPVIISACMGIGGTIMGAAGLSFLGLGIQPPLPEWGAMLNDGRSVMRYYPTQLIAPMVCIALVVLSVSLFGDGLRDAMDPRLKE